MPSVTEHMAGLFDVISCGSQHRCLPGIVNVGLPELVLRVSDSLIRFTGIFQSFYSGAERIFTDQSKLEGGGSAGEGSCCCDNRSSICRTHTMERENKLLEIALWPSLAKHGTSLPAPD